MRVVHVCAPRCVSHAVGEAGTWICAEFLCCGWRNVASCNALPGVVVPIRGGCWLDPCCLGLGGSARSACNGLARNGPQLLPSVSRLRKYVTGAANALHKQHTLCFGTIVYTVPGTPTAQGSAAWVWSAMVILLHSRRGPLHIVNKLNAQQLPGKLALAVTSIGSNKVNKSPSTPRVLCSSHNSLTLETQPGSCRLCTEAAHKMNSTGRPLCCDSHRPGTGLTSQQD